MRILFLNYEYPPLGGGAANATFYILQEFSKISDLQVDLITSSPSEKYEEEKFGENVIVYKLPIGKNSQNLHFQSQKDLLMYAFKAYQFSRRLMKKNKYDLSHSFFTVPCGFLSWLLFWEYKLPYIISLRGADVPGYSERFTNIYGVLKPLVRLIWKRAKFVIANSQGLKELALKTNCRQKIGLIYNGVNIDQFKPSEENFRERENKDYFTILCISRLTERKGINYLISALSRIAVDDEKIKLIIAGDGSARASLEKQAQDLNIADKIDFLGRINHDQLPQIYQKADVFVLPSLNEGMSNTMLEALASGLPIIATDTGGTRELVTEGENGLIIGKKDAIDIMKKIKKLIDNPELVSQLGQKSREKALKLSWPQVAENYYQLYKKRDSI